MLCVSQFLGWITEVATQFELYTETVRKSLGNTLGGQSLILPFLGVLPVY